MRRLAWHEKALQHIGNRDSTHVKVHLEALLADRAYDSNHLRKVFAAHADTTCVSSERNRKAPIEHDASNN